VDLRAVWMSDPSGRGAVALSPVTKPRLPALEAGVRTCTVGSSSDAFMDPLLRHGLLGAVMSMAWDHRDYLPSYEHALVNALDVLAQLCDAHEECRRSVVESMVPHDTLDDACVLDVCVRIADDVDDMYSDAVRARYGCSEAFKLSVTHL
jgi:hypothetical protein